MPIDYTKPRGGGGTPAEEPPSSGKIDYSRRERGATPTEPATTPATPAPAAATPPVSPSKVVLTKASPTVSLTKSGAASGSMRLNLRWTARPSGGGGFFKRAAPAIDLDLGCLYEFSDGSKGVVQALGNAFVAADRGRRPIITLDGDDRSGSGAGENIHVDMSRPEAIARILFFAMIYEGAPNWAEADGIVTIHPQTGPEIETRLDATSARARICAIALLERHGSELVLRRENQYVDGAQDVLDRTYGWGLNWKAGRK